MRGLIPKADSHLPTRHAGSPVPASDSLLAGSPALSFLFWCLLTRRSSASLGGAHSRSGQKSI